MSLLAVVLGTGLLLAGCQASGAKSQAPPSAGGNVQQVPGDVGENADHGWHLELSQSFRSHTSTRLLAALDRHEGCVRRVDVRFGDVNGPRGGVDKNCEILIDSPHMGRLVITEAGDDLYTTITRAVHHATELLGRLRRQRRWQRN